MTVGWAPPPPPVQQSGLPSHVFPFSFDTRPTGDTLPTSLCPEYCGGVPVRSIGRYCSLQLSHTQGKPGDTLPTSLCPEYLGGGLSNATVTAEVFSETPPLLAEIMAHTRDTAPGTKDCDFRPHPLPLAELRSNPRILLRGNPGFNSGLTDTAPAAIIKKKKTQKKEKKRCCAQDTSPGTHPMSKKKPQPKKRACPLVIGTGFCP